MRSRGVLGATWIIVGVVIANLFIGRQRLIQRTKAAVANMQLPQGASARFLPAPSFGHAGYEIRLRPFDAASSGSVDATINGVPDTEYPIVVYWRFPRSENGTWQKSVSEITYEVTVGGQTYLTRSKWNDMRGMESGADLNSIYLYADVGSLIHASPAGKPLTLRACYIPGKGERLDYTVEPIISSGGYQ